MISALIYTLLGIAWAAFEEYDELQDDPFHAVFLCEFILTAAIWPVALVVFLKERFL